MWIYDCIFSGFLDLGTLIKVGFDTFEEVLGFNGAHDCLTFDGAIVPFWGITLLMITITLA